MLLALLFSILTATYTLSSTTSVKASGVLPEGATHTYERSATTGQKGQMTAGNSTRLYLTGWEGCTIRTVTLSMRSNKSAGAGSLKMLIGKEVVWQIDDQSFADAAWAETFTTDWVDIVKNMNVEVRSGEAVEIIISATQNSLYMNSYTINYEAPVSRCYSVEFVTGLDTILPPIMQAAIGEPILLPAWQDTAIWHFIGWSETEVEDAQWAPSILPAGTQYLPTHDTKLYAVYSSGDKVLSSSKNVSGEYVMVQRNAYTEQLYGISMGAALLGKVYEGSLFTSPASIVYTEEAQSVLCSMVDSNAIYDIHFLTDSTLTIQHVISGEYIGYHRTSLTNDVSEWRYRLLQDGSWVFYYEHNASTYALYIGAGTDDIFNSVDGYVQHMNISVLENNVMWLYPYIEAEYTSWPFGKFYSVENVDVERGKNVHHVHFGNYDLWIIDGKKYVHLK